MKGLCQKFFSSASFASNQNRPRASTRFTGDKTFFIAVPLKNFYAASSGHTGGVIGHAFADGSIHFISDTVAMDVYMALLSRKEGTTVPGSY